tara:strand:+ start:1083 stop:1382 length:300 start_codon:yes stop_codon:yes gene_type:complete
VVGNDTVPGGLGYPKQLQPQFTEKRVKSVIVTVVREPTSESDGTTPTPGAETTPTSGAETTPIPGAETTPTSGEETTPTPGAEYTIVTFVFKACEEGEG